MDEDYGLNGNGKKQFLEWFRVITPALISLCLFFLGVINYQLRTIDSKIFTHLTNHDIHIPREQIVSQAEFDMYAKNAEQGRVEMVKYFDKMEQNLKDYIETSR